MAGPVDCDPYFDDEDEENEEAYRDLLRQHGTLPPCDPKASPFHSVLQPSVLCSRLEAERILLRKGVGIEPGNFLVRPSIHSDHPYSLSVLVSVDSVTHLQICHISNKFALGPVKSIDSPNIKTFPSVLAFLQYYVIHPLKFQDSKKCKHSIILKLYPFAEITQL